MRFTLVLLLALTTACSGARGPFELPGIPLEVDPTLALSTPNGGVGHGCVVGGYAITARHVMWDENLKMFQDAAYSQGNITGIASINGSWSHLDLVTLGLTNGATFYPRGSVLPGDTVYWFEYDFRTAKNLMRARRRFGTVLRIVAHQIIFDVEPVAGASGTCLFNERGQVAGIVNASWDTGDMRNGGNAVLLPSLVP